MYENLEKELFIFEIRSIVEKEIVELKDELYWEDAAEMVDENDEPLESSCGSCHKNDEICEDLITNLTDRLESFIENKNLCFASKVIKAETIENALMSTLLVKYHIKAKDLAEFIKACEGEK